MTLAVIAYDPLLDKRYRDTALGPSVVDWLAWMELGGASPRTLDTYERVLARGAMMYPDAALETFGDDEMLQVAKSFKPAERRTRIAAYRSFFKWARKQRLIVEDPTDALPEFKPPAPKVYDCFTDTEIELLCGLPNVDGTLMRILLYAGLRKGEARQLQLKHFVPDMDGLEHGAIVVHHGKGSKDRVVPIPQGLNAALNDLALLERLEPSDHLWYSVKANATTSRRMRGKAIGEGTFARWWTRCIAEAGVRYRKPHMTRHTYATRALRRGVPLVKLKKWMGHSSISTTSDLYEHLALTDSAADVALLESDLTKVA